MRLACDSCGALGPVAVTLAGDGRGVVARCTHCGATEDVAAPGAVERAAVAGATDGAAAPDRRCPKCQVEYGARDACPGCGLAVARMQTFAAARSLDVPDSVQAAWRAALERWEEQPRHDGFVQLVASAGVFAWAAGQYQEVHRRRPDDAIAARQLDRVRRTAEAAMLASAAVREVDKRPYRGATAILVMMVVVLIAGALYATFVKETRGPNARGTPAVPLKRGVVR